MSQRASSRPRMTGEIRFRVPLVLLPVIILLAIALVAFGFSRVMLALEAEVATVIALVSAANLLGAATFMALRPEAARRRWPELLAVVLYPVLIGIAVAPCTGTKPPRPGTRETKRSCRYLRKLAGCDSGRPTYSSR